MQHMGSAVLAGIYREEDRERVEGGVSLCMWLRMAPVLVLWTCVAGDEQ